MQNRPGNWQSLFNSAHKTEYQYIINGVTYTEADVQGTPVLERPLMQAPCIGRCTTGSLTIVIRKKPNAVIPRAASVIARCRLVSRDQKTSTGWLDLGRYWVSKRKGLGELVTLTCRDAMILAGRSYTDRTSFREWPVRMSRVVPEIASLMGISVDPRSPIVDSDAYMVDYPNEDVLMSEVLSMIASAHGGSFVITATGQLRLIPFPQTGTPVQAIAGAYSVYTPLSTGEKTISKIDLTDTAENHFIAGDDTGMTLSAACDYATQSIVDNIGYGCSIRKHSLQVLKGTLSRKCLTTDSARIDGHTIYAVNAGIIGARFMPYTLTGAYIDPALELGDTFTIRRRNQDLYLIAASIKIRLNPSFVADISNEIQEDDEDEYPYVSPAELQEKRYIRSGQSYYGNRINRKEGFVSDLIQNDQPVARLMANANEFSMRRYVNGAWEDCIYFDPVKKQYRIVGSVDIAGVVTFEDLSTEGKTVINGENITTGKISTGSVQIGNGDRFYWTGDYIVAQNPNDKNQQIRYGLYDGENYGIGFTQDGGKTWQSAIGFSGLDIKAGSITQTMLSPDIDIEQIKSSDTAPSSPEDGQLWMDTSVSPAQLKRYDSTSRAWVIVNDVDLSGLETRITDVEHKVTDSAIISTVTSSETYRTDIGNNAKAASDAQKAANTAQNGVSSLETRMNSAEQKITSDAIVNTVRTSSAYYSDLSSKSDKQLLDTRDDNQPPSWYWINYPKQTITEFKNRSAVSAPGSTHYGTLRTEVPWGDSSGGPVVQTFTSNEGTYERRSTSESTWGAWRTIEDVDNAKSRENVLATRISSAEQKITADAIVGTVRNSTSYKNDLGGKADASTVTALTERVNSAEQKITAQAIVNTVTSSTAYKTDINNNATAAANAQKTANTAQNGVSSLETRMSSAEQKITASAIVSTVRSSSAYTADLSSKSDKYLPDTRSTNQLPSWYWANYPRQVISEFKQRSAISAPGSTIYGTLRTEVSWNDQSGGPIVQTFTSSDGTFERRSTSTSAWGAWRTLEDVASVTSKITQNTNSWTAYFNQIGMAGKQTGITSIGINGLKVTHSNIGGYTQLSADGLRMYNNSNQLIGGMFAQSGRVFSAVQCLMNPQQTNFRISVAPEDVGGEQSGMHFIINGADAGKISAYNDGSSKGLRIDTDGQLGLYAGSLVLSSNQSISESTNGDILFYFYGYNYAGNYTQLSLRASDIWTVITRSLD